MKRERGRRLAFLLALVWLTWSTALSGVLAQSALFAGWAPDLTIALLASLLGFLTRRDVPRLLLLAALARASLSIEAPIALVAGFLAMGVAAGLVRGFVDLRDPFARAGLAALAAPAMAAWLELVRASRAGGEALLESGDLLRLALSSGLLALVAGDLLARLPGLSPLRKRPW